MGARASATALAESTASQWYARQPSQTAIGTTQLNALRVEFIDSSESRWQRDPGRARGPFS